MACFGVSLVFRVSLILVLFHTGMLLISLTRTSIASAFHDGCWMFKYLAVAGMIIGSFWVLPIQAIMLYGQISRIFSFLFLIFQGISILSISYVVNDNLVNYYEEQGTTCSVISILGLTVFVYLFDICFFIF